MNMIAIACCAFALLAQVFLWAKQTEKQKISAQQMGIGVLLSLLILGLAFSNKLSTGTVVSPAHGLAFSCLSLVHLFFNIDSKSHASRLIGFGLGLGLSMIALDATQKVSPQLAQVIAATSLFALAFRSKGALFTALGALAAAPLIAIEPLIKTQLLTPFSPNLVPIVSGLLIISGLVSEFIGEKKALLAFCSAIACCVTGSVLIAQAPALKAIVFLPIVALAIGSILYFLLSENGLLNNLSKQQQLLFVSLIWVAFGTLGFSLGLGTGLALSALFALVVTAILIPNLAGSTALLFALALLRAFKGEFDRSALTLELTTHNTVLSLLVGILVGLIAINLATKSKLAWVPLVAGLSIIMVSVACPVLFGIRSIAGLIIGGAVAALFCNLDTEDDAPWSGLTIGLLSMPVIAAFPLVVEMLDLTRAEKTTHVVIGAVGIFTLVILQFIEKTPLITHSISLEKDELKGTV